MSCQTSEQRDQLGSYVELLLKWNRSINLIASNTIEAVWERHVNDSLQLMDQVPVTAKTVVDVGSGAGFPGVVLAIALGERVDRFALVERDRRKSVFLKEVRRHLSLNYRVYDQSVEALPGQKADVLTARAFTSLVNIMPVLQRHLAKNGLAVLPKGENWQTELDAAAQQWHFDYEVVASKTNTRAAVLKISNPSLIGHD